MYVYVRSHPDLFTVGHYDSGDWIAESDHPTAEAAAQRVAELNGGGSDAELRRMQRQLIETQGAELKRLRAELESVTKGLRHALSCDLVGCPACKIMQDAAQR